MLGNEKKKLIIVVNDKTAVYGELLSALISMKDDRDDSTVVGIKDGSVEAVVWDEKTYQDNQPKLGSNSKIIFIGDLKVSKAVKPNMNFRNTLSNYGIMSGSLGNKGMLCIDSKPLSKDKALYDSFILSYSGFINSIGTEYSKDQVVVREFHIEDYENNKRNGIKKVIDAPIKLLNKILPKKKDKGELTTTNAIPQTSDNVAKGAQAAGQVIRLAVPYFWPSEIIEVVGYGMIKAKSEKNIADQQYRYGVFDFYINKLAKFME